MNKISDLPEINNLENPLITFKYKKEIEDCDLKSQECPPKYLTPKNSVAYRWVFSPYRKDCFNPPAVKSPQRVNNNKLTEEHICGLFGMSMHKSLDASIKAFQFLEKTNKKIREKMATHVAEGNLTSSNGLCTPEDEFGHFDFYEYKNNDCSGYFKVIKEIPKL